MPKQSKKNAPKQKNAKVRVIVKRSPKRPRKVTSRRGPGLQALPAAYSTHVRPSCTIVSRSANVMRVSGRDLVYRIPDELVSSTNPVFVTIPCNPAYWKGTRVANFAAAYMNYRPIRLTFSYIPQVSVVQAGTIIAGTLWNGAALPSEYQQTLVTSNGGGMVQCYLPGDFHITLGSNLQQNLFTTGGDLNPDTSPFIFVACVAGATVVPGYFFVSYTFEFKNPVGSAWSYGTTLTTDASQVEKQADNTSFVNRDPIVQDGKPVFGPGTIFDVEEVIENGSKIIKFIHKGSEVAKELMSLVSGWFFNSGQSTPIPVGKVADLEAEISKLKAENQALVTGLQEANDKITTLTGELDEAQSALDTAKADNAGLEEENAQLQDEVDRLNGK